MLNKILVTTDFSVPSEKLFDCIPEFKALGTEHVVLVHVIDYRTASGSATALKKLHEDKLAEYKRQLEELDLQAKVVVVLGSPAAEIVQIARKEQVSMIVMGSHGAGSVKSILLGSTTIDTVRLTEMPILIEKYRFLDSPECELACREKLHRVIVPIDFSSKSLAVVEWLKELESRSLNSRIVLVAAIESSLDQDDLDKQREAAEKRLVGIGEELAGRGFDVGYEVRVGAASENILDVANKEDATLIVMSTLGAGSIRGLLVGSTTDAVMRHAKCPLLLIPPQ